MRWYPVFLAWVAAWIAAVAAHGAEVLTFGVVPTESAVSLRKDYEALRVALERSVGRRVEMFFAPDYTGVIEAMRFGRVQVGVFGNNSAIDAVDRAGGVVVAQCVDRDGNRGYWSLILVHRDSPVRDLGGLLERRSEYSLAMGDPQSTSGSLVPGYYAFAKADVNPAREFRAFRRSNHEGNVLAVANRQVDACTCSSETLERLRERVPAVAARVREIWRSPLIAMDAVVIRRDLPGDLKASLTAFFATYGEREEERKAVAGLLLSGFRPSSNAQLVPFRLMRLERERAVIEVDEGMAADERRRRLAEFAAAQAALEAVEASGGPDGSSP